MHATAATPLSTKPGRSRSSPARTGPITPRAHLIWSLRQRSPAAKARESITVDLTGPIKSRRFASVGARIDVGEDVALAHVPGHLVCAFETVAPASPNHVDPLDSDVSSALVLTTLEMEGVEVTVDGRAVPLKTATLLKPGTVLGFGAECEYVVERNAFAHA